MFKQRKYLLHIFKTPKNINFLRPFCKCPFLYAEHALLFYLNKYNFEKDEI